jgi:DmsE family decaheme c-type cytochrome
MRSTPFLPLVVALLAPGAASAAGTSTKPAASTRAAAFNLKPGADGKVCLECHIDVQELLKKAAVHTPVKAGQCTSCHSPHSSDHGKLLASAGNETCTGCHATILPEAATSTHKPISEKGCTGCHDPHASQAKFNLVKGGNELCAGCHDAVAEIAAKAKFKHKPIAAQGCVACHDPHGSAKAPSLLRNAVPGLCTGCHKTERPMFTKAHLGYPVGNATCTSCHDPHGSNTKAMLYDRVHPPVAKNLCSQCHEPATSATPLRTRQQGMALCRSCHAPIVTKMLEKARVHRPLLEGASCLTCHNPHASPKKGLLRAGGAINVCGKCHADTIRRQDLSPTKHEPIAGGECARCHDPHSGDAPLMFVKADVVELCGTCHDWLKHSSHPMGAKYKDPRNKNLSVQCLSCHRSHGTEYKHLIPYATTSNLCTKCHEDLRR